MTKLDKNWIVAKIKRNHIKQQVLAAAHCANACRHLIKNERSLRAIDTLLNYKSYSNLELENIEDAADAAAYAAAGDADYAVHHAGWVAAYAAARAANHAANAIYSAAKALNHDKLIESIINEYLPQQ